MPSPRTRQSGPLDSPAAKEPKTNVGRIASLHTTDEAQDAERGPSPMGYKVGATSNSPMYLCRNDLCDELFATQGLEAAHAVSCLKRRPVQSADSDSVSQNPNPPQSVTGSVTTIEAHLHGKCLFSFCLLIMARYPHSFSLGPKMVRKECSTTGIIHTKQTKWSQQTATPSQGQVCQGPG